MKHISNRKMFYDQCETIKQDKHTKNQITIRIHTFEERFGRFFPHCDSNLYISADIRK